MAIRSYLLIQRLHTWVLDDHTPCEDDWVLLVRLVVGLFVVTVTGPGPHQTCNSLMRNFSAKGGGCISDVLFRIELLAKVWGCQTRERLCVLIAVDRAASSTPARPAPPDSWLIWAQWHLVLPLRWERHRCRISDVASSQIRFERIWEDLEDFTLQPKPINIETPASFQLRPAGTGRGYLNDTVYRYTCLRT